METLTIDLSTLLFHLIIYYICFNLITILIGWGDNFANQTKTIKKFLNPFRDSKNIEEEIYVTIFLITFVPYLLIIWLESIISEFNINIIW